MGQSESTTYYDPASVEYSNQLTRVPGAYKPTQTHTRRMRRLGFRDVRPSEGYGNYTKAGVEHLEAALTIFNTWGQLMDEQPGPTKNHPDIQVISGRIRLLQDNGQRAVECAQHIAGCYEEFASIQSERFNAAVDDEALEKEDELYSLRINIESQSGHLDSFVLTITENLDQLATEVDDLRERHMSQPESLWEKIKAFLGRILNGLAYLCDIATVGFGVSRRADAAPFVAAAGYIARAAAESLSRRDRADTNMTDEQFKKFVRVLKSTIPFEVGQSKNMLQQHTHCLQRLVQQVENSRVATYISREDAERAGREWAAEAMILAPYAPREDDSDNSDSD